MPPRRLVEAVQPMVVRAAPLRVADTAAVSVLMLAAASDEEPESVAEMRAWNASGREPFKTGVFRKLLRPQPLTRISSSNTTTFTAKIHVERAAALRLHLAAIKPGDAMWVWGSDGQTIAFDASSCFDNGCWTPTVFSDSVSVEIHGGDASGAVVDGVVETPGGVDSHEMSATVQAAPSCFLDATCVTSSTLDVIADYRSAVAHIEFSDSSGSYQCTGALINNGPDNAPQLILMTANHCISTAAAASSLQAFWDYKTAFCGGSAPSRSTLQRSIGSVLLSTSSLTDYTLLKLNAVPGGRALLGWDATPPPAGTRLYRISHPADAVTTAPYAQMFSTTIVDATTTTCSKVPRPYFVSSDPAQGGVQGGSSGAPVITTGGYIVGQLYGSCSAPNTDVCSAAQLVVDGAFAQTFPSVAGILDPAPAAASCSACVADAHTVCALGGRFKVSVRWHDNVSGTSGTGSVVKYADNVPESNPTYGVLSEMMYFSFYPQFPNSVEVVAKMVKGVGINDKFWAFGTSVNSSEYFVDIVDTKTCRTWTGHQPFGQLTTIADYSAFPFP